MISQKSAILSCDEYTTREHRGITTIRLRIVMLIPNDRPNPGITLLVFPDINPSWDHESVSGAEYPTDALHGEDY